MNEVARRITPAWKTSEGLFKLAAVGLALAMALPAMAADERAIKSKVSPVYPEIAKRMKITGTVKLEAIVDADGKVAEVKILSGNSMLSPAAEEAVRKWKFAPGPAESKVDVDLNFALPQ
jgi:TonB family protein